MKDYYRILQVHPEADLTVMNGAYRSLVRKFHPDLYHTRQKKVMNEKMQEINEAYQVLSNPAARSSYDERYRKSKVHSSSPLPIERPLKERLKRMLWWSLGSYVALVFFVKPFLANPFVKLLALSVFLYIGFRLYLQQKKSKP